MSEQPTGDHIPEWTQLDRLRKAREDAGLEQAELAERIGIGRTTVGNYERGVTAIKRPVLLSWAMATGVPLPWLTDGSGGMFPDPLLPRLDSNQKPAGNWPGVGDLSGRVIFFPSRPSGPVLPAHVREKIPA